MTRNSVAYVPQRSPQHSPVQSPSLSTRTRLDTVGRVAELAIVSISLWYFEWRGIRRWYSASVINLNSSGSSASPGKWIGVVCDEAIFISSSNPSRQAIAYALSGSVVANSLNDGCNRNRATSISTYQRGPKPPIGWSITGESTDG